MQELPPIAIVGATGRLGRLLVARLVEKGHAVRAIGRSWDRLETLRAYGLSDDHFRQADIKDTPALATALAGTTTLVNAARARFTKDILAARPDTLSRMIIVGSTRRYTRYLDKTAEALIEVEAALSEEKSLAWTLLHPTMIYGSAGEDNLQRVARLVRLSPVIFLPQGGRALIQPIHVEDVADATVAAVLSRQAPHGPAVLAGPEPIAYADLVRAVGAALGRRPIILPLPYRLMQAAAFLLRTLPVPGLPKITADEVRRLLEDKDFDPATTVALLGRRPRNIQDGLTEMFQERRR